MKIKLRAGYSSFHEVCAGFFVRRLPGSGGWEASPWRAAKIAERGRSKAEAIGRAYLRLEEQLAERGAP